MSKHVMELLNAYLDRELKGSHLQQVEPVDNGRGNHLKICLYMLRLHDSQDRELG